MKEKKTTEQKNYETKEKRRLDKQEQESITTESMREMASIAQQMLADPRYEAFKTLFEVSMNICKEQLETVCQQTDSTGAYALRGAFLSGRIFQTKQLLLGSPEDYVKEYNDYLEWKKQRDLTRKTRGHQYQIKQGEENDE